jgi:large subunit ribosomal protein L16
MGKGKGNPEYWVTVIKPGRIMFEIEGVPRDSAALAVKLASRKLPVKVRFVERSEGA